MSNEYPKPVPRASRLTQAAALFGTFVASVSGATEPGTTNAIKHLEKASKLEDTVKGFGVAEAPVAGDPPQPQHK